MGALVTLELPDDSPVLALPWIITFGPLGDDEEWEPVVCGPYERAHAMSLAETVVADEELMAVVEPVMPHTSVDEIRGEIASAKAAAQAEQEEGGYDPADSLDDLAGADQAGDEAMRVAVDDEYDADRDASGSDLADDDAADYDAADYEAEYDDLDDLEEVEPSPPPSPAEVRAGFARIAARLTSGS